ncbi:MAG: hypothetical protein SPL80_08015 [Bacilli bacterium]|nr:hypothetical protein [Bacilli bacterium]
MKRELLAGLTEEQIQKVYECADVNDLCQLASDEGVKLTDEQLKAVTGGGCTSSGENKDQGNDKKRKIDS